MFSSVLIANRGEIACRIIRTARAMGLRTVAVFSEPDAGAPHVTMADEAVALTGASAAETYLSIDKLIDAAALTDAQAVHPGYGFLAENAAFAQACQAAGLVFVGPAPDVIAAMGDKIAAKARMRDIGVPVAADALLGPDVDATAAAHDVGFPLLVKAAAGGGGKGMRLVTSAADVEQAVAAARREAANAFGDERVFLERFVTTPRHVEVQVLGDSFGSVVHLGERECSVQRRHQKIIEESPSPAVTSELREQMTDAAVRAARELAYTSAGTVEFLVDGSGDFFFLEVNTRIQVEHPVTEMAWGIRGGEPLDLVRLQLLVAAGQPLPFGQADVEQRAHAVEARLYAEDPDNGFLPATGRLRSWSIPSHEAVRVDGGVAADSDITVHYDPMLAKVIAAAPSRGEAVNLLAATLQRSRIHGVTTNREFLVRALRSQTFLSGSYDTSFVEQLETSPARAAFADSCHAVAAALVEAHRNHRNTPLPSLPPAWRNNRSAPPTVTYRAGDHQHTVGYARRRDGTWEVAVGDATWTVVVHSWNQEVIDLQLDQRRVCAHVKIAGAHVDVDSALGATSLVREPRFPDSAAEEVEGGLLAPMPGTVLAVHVEPGAAVTQGDLLLVLEAMKMEHRVTAPTAGAVAEVRVAAGDPVATDDVLIVLEEAAE